jgi:hypothetical protein
LQRSIRFTPHGRRRARVIQTKMPARRATYRRSTLNRPHVHRNRHSGLRGHGNKKVAEWFHTSGAAGGPFSPACSASASRRSGGVALRGAGHHNTALILP